MAKQPPQTLASSLPNDWDGLLGHDHLKTMLATALRKRRLGGSLLFVGPHGVGKTSAALLLAQTMFCRKNAPQELAPCGTCPDCQQVRARTHPDLIQAGKPEEKTLIPLEILIGPVDARLQEGFCHDVHLRPMQADRKVAILHDADFLNEEGANCLLKTLEEPPANALIILIGTSEQKQLPTIRSRCQTMRLSCPTNSAGRQLLRLQLQHHAESNGVDVADVPELDDEALDKALRLSAGDMHAAVRIALGTGGDYQEKLFAQINSPIPDPIIISRCINDHLDAASKKENSLRRAAFRDLCAFVIQHYRGQLRGNANTGIYDETVHIRLDRTLRVYRELDRSANLGTLVDCYSADLTLATTGDRGAIG